MIKFLKLDVVGEDFRHFQKIIANVTAITISKKQYEKAAKKSLMKS